jgi:hypothetical protein
MSGAYTVTITGANGCTASIIDTISVVNCLSVSGNIFDDANGNGKFDTNETKTNYNQTLYSVLADTNGLVLATSAIASDGSFSMGNVLPYTTGMTVRVSTANPSIGSTAPANTWPANWVGTLGAYGTNNNAGTGVYNNSNELIPMRMGTVNITNILMGFDRLQAPVTQSFSISRPSVNSVKALNASAGLGNITWADPEDGANIGSFVVTNISGMHNNVLFYDSNNNNLAESSEIISGYRIIPNFNAQLLKTKFTAIGTSSISFSFGYIDAAGKTNPTSSTYTVSWTGGALPVKLVFFEAVLNPENKVNINWSTASEVNSAYFEIERSSDAIDFTGIDSTPAAGNSEETINYSAIDDNPLPGISYYRLKQVDLDGSFTYSEIVSVFISGVTSDQSSSVKVFPTLITSPSVNIDVSGTDAPVKVSVFDNAGRMVMTRTVPPNANTRVDISSAKTGMYIVVCETTSNSTSTKVVYTSGN